MTERQADSTAPARKPAAAKKTAAKKTAAKAASTRPASSALRSLAPNEAVAQVLAGDIGSDNLKYLSVPAQTLLVEVLLEQSRQQHFDANNRFTGDNFGNLVGELLHCSSARTRTVLTHLRSRKSYHSSGGGRGTRVTFTGSAEAKALLDEFEAGLLRVFKENQAVNDGLAEARALLDDAEAGRVSDAMAGFKIGFTATPPLYPHQEESLRAMTDPLRLPSGEPNLGLATVGYTLVVSISGMPQLVRSDGRLVRVLADRIFADIDGDPVLAMALIVELASRLRT